MRYLFLIALAAMIATVAYNIKGFAEIAAQAPPATIAIGLGLLILAAAVAIIGMPFKLALVMAILCSTAYVMADGNGVSGYGSIGTGNTEKQEPLRITVHGMTEAEKELMAALDREEANR